MSIIHLADRALVRMAGADTEALLQRLITTNLDALTEGKAGYGALLTPQGKILFDFLVTRQGDGFLFDLHADIVADFVKKMTLYRLRSAISIDILDDQVGHSFEEAEGAVRDPRAETLGYRFYGAADKWEQAPTTELDQRFIDAAIPQGGKDFAFGDAFPHDVNMDFLGAIDFTKGCYVGQEVVSRMKHRGTARKRLVNVDAEQTLPETGASITVDGKTVGTLGQVVGSKGLAIVRLDRISDAIKESQVILASDVEIKISIPSYASFSLETD